MFDFNNEDAQKEFASGPVPAGSKVMLRLNIEKPQHESKPGSFVSQTKNGMLGLWCKFEVVHGTYEGVSWHETMWLPEGYQRVAMTEGWRKAVRIAGAKFKAIIEAHRRINPSDKSPRANEARHVHSVLDFNGMTFPAKVGIEREGREYNGRTYWNNILSTVITPDKDEFQTIVQGGEIITDGPVQGSGGVRNQQSGVGEYDDHGPAYPSEAANFDDIPF